MQEQIDLLQATRSLVLKTVESLSIEEINKTPINFNNNIAWNVAHIVVTQQLLNYGLSKNPIKLDNTFVEKYRKGTSPSTPINAAEWKEILRILEDLPNALQADYQAGIFKEFKEYPTSYGYVLHNIQDSIAFNNAHEALHLGYIMALKKAIL